LAVGAAQKSTPWLFSGPLDLAIFGGSALLSLLALWLGAALGVLHSETPDWTWIPAVLLVDVAHVYSTAFRIYLDPEERRRRPLLYTLMPLFGFLGGVALYWYGGPFLFWRVLAYAAVYHFVRQQYGFVILYRARMGETGRFSYWLDTLTIYAATLYPLLYWHTHLPRGYTWFSAGDFFSLPLWVYYFTTPTYWALLTLYAVRALWLRVKGQAVSHGKDLLVLTTVLCWYIGIITFNSDYAFTVTNVLIHGIPYLALIFWYGKRQPPSVGSVAHKIFMKGPWLFLFLLWGIAYVEELIWDRALWQDRGWFFGAPWELGDWEVWLVPLLALPQLTHYLLDGFIWKRRQNPGIQRALL
jgi:hypothetical protein